MIRTLVCVAASLLLVGTLFAEDKENTTTPENKPEAKADAVKKEGTEAKPAAPEQRKRGRPQADGHRGRVTKVENGVIKLSADGKEYEFAVTENTHAMLRTTEKDGKQVVVGLQLMNGDARQGGRRPAGQKRTRPRTKP